MTAQVLDPPPPLAIEVAAGRPLRPVWRNEIGGTTWQVTGADGARYLKVGPLHPEFDPTSDADRLRWLGAYVSVPTPVSVGERDGWGWLETAAIPGRMGFGPQGGAAEPWAGRDADVVRALGAALRRFHDIVPVDRCPYDWSLGSRLARCRSLDVESLGRSPEVGADLVVCHGDACNPNFLLHDDLTASGYVDVGRCGLADRWADLAPATISVGWNFGDGLAHHLLDGYGIGRDLPMNQAKLAFYRAVWELPGAD